MISGRVAIRPRAKGSRARASAARLLFLVCAGAFSGCAGSPGARAPEPETPPAEAAPSPVELTPATFTATQAESGRRIFGSVCSVCHGRNEFRGPIFELTWVAEPVGHLFQHISTTMPQDRPGSLTPEEYASVVAYLLELNGRQPGDRTLPADGEILSRMRW